MVSVAATKSVLKAVILQEKKHIVDALIAVNNAETQYPQIEKKNPARIDIWKRFHPYTYRVDTDVEND